MIGLVATGGGARPSPRRPRTPPRPSIRTPAVARPDAAHAKTFSASKLPKIDRDRGRDRQAGDRDRAGPDVPRDQPAAGGAPFPGLYVPSDEFAAQMEALKAAGWHAVTMDQLEAYWKRGVPLGPGKPSCSRSTTATRLSTKNALPVLKRLGWVGNENIQLTGLPPSQGGLTDAQVRGLIAAGWELDTQGISHADLITLDASELKYQVATARQTLQKRYGVPVNWFCYPSGHYDATVIAAVKSAGFVGSTTVIPGWASRGEDPYRLPVCASSAARARPDCSPKSARLSPPERPRRRTEARGRRERVAAHAPWRAARDVARLEAELPHRRRGLAAAGRGRHRRDLSAQITRAGRVAERRVPARGAARVRVLGARARHRHVAAQRGRVQLLPPPPHRPVHDRRQPQLGRARRRSRSSRPSVSTVAELARSRALEADRRRAEADLAAALARDLLGGSETVGALARPRRRVARRHSGSALGGDRARSGRGDRRRRAFALQRRRRRRRSRRCSSRAGCPPDTEQRLRDARRARARRARRDRAAPRRAAGRGRSRPRRCGAATTSRRRCCARSRTTCARR